MLPENLCPPASKYSWNCYKQSQITSEFYTPLLRWANKQIAMLLFYCYKRSSILKGFYFQMFKQPLEEMTDTEEDNSNGKTQALLNNTELKIIFGNLPPIYELHQWVR